MKKVPRDANTARWL